MSALNSSQRWDTKRNSCKKFKVRKDPRQEVHFAKKKKQEEDNEIENPRVNQVENFIRSATSCSAPTLQKQLLISALNLEHCRSRVFGNWISLSRFSFYSPLTRDENTLLQIQIGIYTLVEEREREKERERDREIRGIKLVTFSCRWIKIVTTRAHDLLWVTKSSRLMLLAPQRCVIREKKKDIPPTI